MEEAEQSAGLDLESTKKKKDVKAQEHKAQGNECISIH